MSSSNLYPLRKSCFALLVFFIAILSQIAFSANIILMISDGAGFNTFDCASFYQYGTLGKQVYDNFPIRLGCTTYSVGKNGVPIGYNHKKAWSDFEYLRNATDSPAASTALNTGVKTINGRICIDKDGNKLTTLAQIADSKGKSTGVVTTVQFSHATPAAAWAHNISRYNYEEIAKEMIYQSGLDVIMGCGHPRYDNNGKLQPKDKRNFKYCGTTAVYNDLVTESTNQGWTFFDSKTDFEFLANDPNANFRRVIGLAQAVETLQYKRTGKRPGNLNKNVPTLPTMTIAAINILSKDEDGFFLMIEAGAVDWANHNNNLMRMIEEQIEFNRTIETVVEWIERNSSWEQTLLIITADHETGQLWGPDAGYERKNPYDLPKNNGQGIIPATKYFHGGHTNVLVPLYAKGKGSELFEKLIDGIDPVAAKKWNFSGKYVDNTDVFEVMKAALDNQNIQK